MGLCNNNIDDLISDLRLGMGDLCNKGDMLTKQMWLLYVTFEDFVHLQHPDKADKIMEHSVDKWIGPKKCGTIAECSSRKKKDSQIPKSMGDKNRSSKPWEADKNRPNPDPIYTDKLIQKIACMNNLKSGVCETEKSSGPRPVLWKIDDDGAGANGDIRQTSATKEKKEKQPIMGTAQLVHKKTASKSCLNITNNAEFYDLESEYSIYDTTCNTRTNHQTKKRKSRKPKKDRHNSDSSKRELIKQDREFHQVTKTMQSIIHDLQQEPVEQKCQNYAPGNFPFERNLTDEGYNASQMSALTFDYTTRLLKSSSCSTGLDSGFSTLSSSGNDTRSAHFALSSKSDQLDGTGTELGLLGECVTVEEPIYEEIRDEDLDTRFGDGIVSSQLSKSLNDLSRPSDSCVGLGYGTGARKVQYPYAEQSHHLEYPQNNMLENSVISMVFSNLDKFESSTSKRRENFYYLISNKDNRQLFSDSLAIEKKLIENGLIYPKSHTGVGLPRRVRGRAEMRGTRI